MTEQNKLTTVSTRIMTPLNIVQTGQKIDTTHSADYNTIITKSVTVQLSDQYDNCQQIIGKIHVLT